MRATSLQALAAVDAAVDGARERECLARAGHAHVAQPAFLFELFRDR